MEETLTGLSEAEYPQKHQRQSMPRNARRVGSALLIGRQGRLLPALVLCCVALGQTYTISTFAGGGNNGIGDNGLAINAQLIQPRGVAVDSAGNVFISDSGNKLVRKVSSGIITSVAGSGRGGFSGDNGPATSATMDQPLGIALDSAGNLFIADSLNNRVRMVSHGVITTVAGNGTGGYAGDNGPAVEAELMFPSAVTIDSAGNLYIADQQNQRIRRVANGIISTVAGDGSTAPLGDGGPAIMASLNFPWGVALDAKGNLFISDTSDDRIREVSGGTISTVAGGGYYPGNGPAVDALLETPVGISLDSAGNLYIPDSGSIRKVSNGIITTIAGNGTGGFSGDNGPATEAQFDFPWAVAVDSSGNVYVADTDNNRIRLLTPSVVPSITSAGVTNAASFQTGISPGGLVTIFGTNLGGAPGTSFINSPPWPAQIGGTSITIDGMPVPAYSLTNLNGEQLSIQAPWSLAGAISATVSITNSAGTSAAVTVPVLVAQPGIFILDGASSGATHLNGAVVGMSNPAARSEVLCCI
jgi:sugar lactone lactonase YvrE